METNNKTIWLYKIALFLLGLLFVLSLFAKCENKPIETNNKAIHDTIKVLQVKADTIEKLRVKLVYKYRSIRDTVNIRDTVEVLQLLDICDTIIVTDSIEINTLRLINNNFAKIVHNDSLVIDSLKHSKKKYFKGFRHGFIAGTILVGGGIGALLIK